MTWSPSNEARWQSDLNVIPFSYSNWTRLHECPLQSTQRISLNGREGRNPGAALVRTQRMLAIMDPDEDDGFVAAQNDD
jgi:hypothetical protein